MAKIVLGMATSHAPQLEMPPQNWLEYAAVGRKAPVHWFAGKKYSFSELLEARKDDHFEKEVNPEKFQTRWDACQKAIAHLEETLNRVAPDVVVILGDDQHEVYQDDNMPALAIFNGESIADAPRSAGEHRLNLSDRAVGRYPPERLVHPAEASLGEHLIESLIEEEFDVARSNKLPEGQRNGTIGHAFYFVYRRLMNNEVIPNVPILVNTYYPPNVPSPSRSYRFGQALRRAIESWDSDKRVAVIASGGLSHTVIEEDLDERILDGLQNNDVEKLTDYPDVRFRAGTSEIKNWIILGGAMADDGLQMKLVDYVPCYRTEAGNGCAMGFAEWM